MFEFLTEHSGIFPKITAGFHFLQAMQWFVTFIVSDMNEKKSFSV